MNKLIYDIFDNMVECIPYQEEADQKISDEVKRQMEDYEKKLSENEREDLQDVCFGVAYTAKREWFAVGVCYALELMGKEMEKC